MKKISYILFLCILAISFVMTSCEEISQPATATETDIEEDGKFQKVTTNVTASAPDFVVYGQSKTTYQLNGNALQFIWSNDDHIGVWPDKNNLLTGTLPQQASFYVKNNPNQSNKAEFEACGWGLIKNMRYYAYYPFDNSASYNVVRIHYDWQRQTADNSTAHLSAYDYMHTTVDAVGSDRGQADFKHLGCVVAFTLKIPQDYRSFSFTSLTLSADSPIFVKEATYNPSVSVASLTATQTASDISISLGTENTQGISCDANGDLQIYMSMSPAIGSASWNNETINMILNSSDNRQFTANIKPDSAQQAGVVYPFTVTMQYDGPVAVNLSQQETANCYVISNAGDYMFRATKGNSSESVTPGSVKVLWETVNTTTSPAINTLIQSGVSYSNGYIYFSTTNPFIEGNAVIAAYSGENCTGDILWSWHIWCTDRPLDQLYSNNAGLLMDRNLGALSTSGNLANGLLFQWGRKDPMMGHTATSSPSAMAASENGTTVVANNASVGTVDWSIKHPNQFIAGATNGDWLYVNPKAGIDYQISNPDTDKSLWYGGEDVKTKYDPCPPGYMVPFSGPSVSDKDFWGTAYNIAFKTTGGDSSFTLGGVTAPYTVNSGLWMPLANGQTSFYPMAGYISSNGTRTNDGRHTMLWTYFPAGSGSATVWNWQYSSCLDVNVLNSASFTTHWNSTRADGKSVRCMRMKKTLEFGNEGFGEPVNSEW